MALWAASSPVVQTPMPDPIEVGRVMATLDDWRTFTFVLFVLLFIAVIERMFASWRFSAERQIFAEERHKMWEIAQRMGVNAEKIADSLNSLAVEVRAFRIISSRVESSVAENLSEKASRDDGQR